MYKVCRFGFFPLLFWLLIMVAPHVAQESGDAAFRVHVVQRGENLFRIALAYDLLAEDIAIANDITDSDAIAVGHRLIIPLTVTAQQRHTHVISTGESLASIAAAYGMPVADLLSLNRLNPADPIYVGQELTIVVSQAEAPRNSDPANLQPTLVPTAAPAISIPHVFSRVGAPANVFAHTVKSGETLSEIALRYSQTIDALARANNMADPSFLSVGQRLSVPGILLPRLTTTLPETVLAFTIEPLVLEAGRSGRIELLSKEAVAISGQFLGRELQVIQRDEGKRHNILVGVPMFTKMSVYPLSLELWDDKRQSSSITANVQVISGGYGRQTINIADSELLAPAVEEEEFALLARLTSGFTPERRWTNSLSLPAAAPINAFFGTLRSYNGSPFDRYHGGVDFAGAPGTSILAAADGVVLMVDRLNIRGNSTLIDHGWGVYTLYAHQDETLVDLGAEVSTGQVIGTVGSTGRSTGPHLHWELWLNGINVDPMQWVQESFP